MVFKQPKDAVDEFQHSSTPDFEVAEYKFELSWLQTWQNVYLDSTSWVRGLIQKMAENDQKNDFFAVS